jgi:hypothetical protein
VVEAKTENEAIAKAVVTLEDKVGAEGEVEAWMSPDVVENMVGPETGNEPVELSEAVLEPVVLVVMSKVKVDKSVVS